MKTSKKLLSVLLAVLMIMTSVSVCFTSFAKSPDTNRLAEFVDALKKPGTKELTVTNDDSQARTIEANSYDSMVAFQAFWSLFTTIWEDNTVANTADYNYTRVRKKILDNVNSEISQQDKTTYDVDYVLAAFLPDVKISEAQDKTGNHVSCPDINITLSVNMSEALKEYDSIAAMPDMFIQTEHLWIHHWSHESGNSGGCNPTKYHTLNIDCTESKFKSEDRVEYTTDTIKAAEQNFTTKTSANGGFADLFAADGSVSSTVDVSYLLSNFAAAQLVSLKGNMENAINAVDDFARAGDTVKDKFFSKYDISGLQKIINAAVDVIVFTDAAKTLDSLIKNTDVDSLSEINDLITAYAKLKSALDAYEACVYEAREYIKGQHIVDTADADAKLNAIKNKIEVIELTNLKPIIEAHVAAYNAYVADPDNATAEGLSTAKGEMQGYARALATYKKSNVTAVFGANYSQQNILPLITSLTVAASTLGFEDEYSREVRNLVIAAAQAPNLGSKSSDLLAEAQTVDEFNSKLDQLPVTDEVKEGLKSRKADDTDHQYTLLNARLEGEIEIGVPLYNSYKSAYGDILNSVTADSAEILVKALGVIEGDLYDGLNNASKLTISNEAKTQYASVEALVKEISNLSGTTYGFGGYKKSEIEDIIRYEDPHNELVRDKDYQVNDANVETIIDKIDTLLGSDFIKNNVGLDLNKTLNDLLQNSIYTDEFINTVVQLLYPLVAQEFAKVWAGLPSEVKDVATGVDLLPKITAKLNLYKLEAAMESIGLQLFPKELAKILPAQYAAVKAKLNTIKTESKYDKDLDEYVSNPWKDANLCDEDGKLDLDWGVNAIEDPAAKKEAFMKAAGWALKGLEPLLLALLSNQEMALSDKIGEGNSNGNQVMGFITVNITIHTITLNLNATANAGYNNMLVPILEALGMKSSDIPNGNDFVNTEQAVRGIFEPIEAIINRLASNPVRFLTDALPNLAYALEHGMVMPLLSMLKTAISYTADASYKTDCSAAAPGTVKGAMKSEEDINIDVGAMLNIKDLLGSDLSSVNDLLDLVVGLLNKKDDAAEGEEAAEGEAPAEDENAFKLPSIDGAKLSTLGELTWQPTGRNDKIYAYGAADRAAYIDANNADVLIFLLYYVVECLDEPSFLPAIKNLIASLGSKDEEASEEEATEPAEPAEDAAEESTALSSILNTVIDNILYNRDDVIAGIAELILPADYSDNIASPDWYESTITKTEIDNLDATAIPYLKYGNDWTRDKAEYLMDNIDDILASVLKMTGSEETSINALLSDKINGIFTNEALTSVAKSLVGIGGKLDAKLAGILAEVLGLDLRTWAATFPEFIEIAEGEEAPAYEDVAKLTGLTYADGVWSVGETTLTDGDREAFFKIFCELIAPFAQFAKYLLTGEDLVVLDTLTVKGYANYANSIGLLFAALGVEDVLGQAEYEALVADGNDKAGLEYIFNCVFDWLDGLMTANDGNVIKNIVEALPGVLYFIESNGLSVVLKNLLMPVLAVVDIVRPALPININDLLSTLVSGILGGIKSQLENGEPIKLSLDLEALLGVITGTATPDKTYSLDVNALSLYNIISLVDKFLGTDLQLSGLVKYGLKALCAGKVEKTYDGKPIFTSEVPAADVFTILVTSLLEALQETCYLGGGETTTNGAALCGFIQNVLPEDSDVNVVEIYNAVVDVINGFEISYEVPNWGYMFGGVFEVVDGTVALPASTMAYLAYDNDWTKETAETLDKTIDSLVDMILDMALKDNSIAGLLNGILEDKVYTNANLKTVVELLVNLLANLDESLYNTIGTVVDANIGAWFDMCDKDEEGKYVLKDGYFNADGDKDAFVAAIKEVLAPANSLLSFLFFGTSYNFFTGSEKNADGEYVYNDIITINGGQGYAYGIVPILEALGCTVKAPEAYKTANGYDVPAAVEDIFNALLARIDEISGKPAHEVLALLPNILYFLNADGIKAAVNSILAPVDAVIGALAPVLKLDADANLGTLLEGNIGINIENLTFETLLGFIIDATGVVIPDETLSVIKTFYIGELTQFTSANGEYAYKMTYTDKESRADMITIVLSFVVELFNANGDLFSDLLGEDTYGAIVKLIKSGNITFSYDAPNWAYMLGGDLEALKAGLPARTPADGAMYLQYSNNWNIATAQYLEKNLQAIIDDVIKAVVDSNSSVGTILENVLADNVYSDNVLNAVVELVVGALKGLDSALVETVGAVLGADVDALFAMCDEDGKCTETWNVTDAASFAAAFSKALAPANRIIGWLFFGESYKFLNGSTGEDLITICGGQGYDYAIVPILEALGCEAKSVDNYSSANANEAVKDVIMAILNKVDSICNDGNTVNDVIDLLVNVIYFVNADGVAVVVNNLLQPVYFLLDTLEPITGKVDLVELAGFDFTNITFETIFDLVADKLGITFADANKAFIENFYIGKAEEYTSVNGATAYKLTWSDKETRKDMITIVLSLVLETLRYKENAKALTDLLGADVYNAIMSVFQLANDKKPMQEFSWLYTEYADTDKTFTGVETSEKYESSAVYDDNWTKEKAAYIADNLPDFVLDIMCLLGIKINGVEIDTIEKAVENLVDDNLYTQANADAIIKLLNDVVGKLRGLEPYGKYIVEIVKNSLDVDLTAWSKMKVNVKDGDMDSFADAIATILAPIAPLFKVLLANESLEFFVDIDGGNIITIPGSEGYAYGIIPLLEALGCKDVKTPDEFKAILATDVNAAVRSVIDPVLNKLADIETDPVNKIFDMLPAIIYFINSNGLDTSVKNILNAIDNVLAGFEPLIGASDVLSLAGIDLGTINFDWLVDYALNLLGEETGNQLAPIAMNAIAELTVGKVVSYKSANGETYYTMKYASNLDKADMVTIILRLLLEFVTMDENINKIEAILAQYIPDETSYKMVCVLIGSIADSVNTENGMSYALNTVYYVYYGLNKGVGGLDDIYHNVNGKWQAVLKSLDESDNPYVRAASIVLKDALNAFLGDVFEPSGVAPNGFIAFFQKIGSFFQRIIDWFKNLFK